MNERKQREHWLQDVHNRQKNIVFPQTLANETRFWGNLGSRTPTTLTWAGLAILGVFVLGGMGYLLVTWTQAGTFWAGALTILVIFGPVFGLIVWATRRNLRKLENSSRKFKTGK